VSEGKLGAGSRAILLLAATVIVLAALKLAAPVLVPILVAACIASAMMPVVNALRCRGVRTVFAVTITTVGVLAALLTFGAVVALAITDMTDSLPRLEQALATAQQRLLVWFQRERLGAFDAPIRSFNPREASSDFVAGVLIGVPSAVSALGVVFFVAIFLLLEGATLNDKLRRALRWSSERLNGVQHTVGEVQRYLLFKGGLAVVVGTLCGTWSAVLGQPHPLVWAVLGFLLHFIPGFGSVATTLAAAMAAVVQQGVGVALLVLVGYVIIHNFVGNLIEPKVLGKASGLSPLVVMISVVVWGWVLGPVGALLAVPLTMVIKIVLAHTDDLRWVAVMLARGEGQRELEWIEENRARRTTVSTAVTGVDVRCRSTTGA
jgi:predicted PurR-regulated permease PerM